MLKLVIQVVCRRQSVTYIGKDGKPIFPPLQIVDRCVKGAFGQPSAGSCYSEATIGAPTEAKCAPLFADALLAKRAEVLKVVHASQQLRVQCEALTSEVSMSAGLCA